MGIDRSDEIRNMVLRQRIDRFRKYLEKKRKKADFNADGSGSSWNNAYAQAFDDVYRRAQKIFRGKEDKSTNLD
jgi:hypothetical protein